ncbi:MAG: hypothetical protein M1828_004483 [Chrysothrix sp. TS-e1954]|nr:MAG: hypothetical protein M1828_004483 [Chrysothrix sp. TS-e1954]
MAFSQRLMVWSKCRPAPLALSRSSALPQHRRPVTKACIRLQSTIQVEPPRRSFLGRSIRLTLYTAVILVSGISAGLGLSLYTLPPQARSILWTIFNHNPTSAETLLIYKPDDPDEKAIDEALRHLPLVTELRQNPSYTESRPALKIPEPIRPTNLTGGTLAGPGRIAVPPLVFADGGHSSFTFLHLGHQLCGHPGILHGGLLATLLDENLARCCFPSLPKKVGVTANLKIDYRKPAPAGNNYVIKAETIKVEGRKAWVKGWIEGVEGDLKGVKMVEAEALFIQPKGLGPISALLKDRYT